MTLPLLLLGAGTSGYAAARLAACEGRQGVVVSEQRPDDSLIQQFESLGFPWQAELPCSGDWQTVLSPGIPFDHPWLKELRNRGVKILPEFEWAAGRLSGCQIAVTGSLGKTSIVMLAAELLKDAGYSVTVSGNIAPPVSEIVRVQPKADFHVIELSSFQLEAAVGYRPDRALCLNLFPNHLDRHADFREYAEAKARLFRFQKAGEVAVWPESYPVEILTGATRIREEDMELPVLGNTAFDASAYRKNLQGLFAVLRGIPGVDAMRQEPVIRAFQFPPHRMQELNIAGAGRVVDDSKSTCLSATRAALLSTPGKVQLVMGGLDKGESLEILGPILRERNPSLYLFGRAAEKMSKAWQDSVDECRTYDTLVQLMPVLWRTRTNAKTLLFSPGCASFDQFPGYAVRGQTFQQLVSRLAAEFPL